MAGKLTGGAAAVEITPKDSQFLYGYPHVERYSTGVHDPLWTSALYLSDGGHSSNLSLFPSLTSVRNQRFGRRLVVSHRCLS